jgi:phage terminase large subunit
MRKPTKREISAAEELVKQFTIAATAKGCPQDQIFNFARADLWLQPKQLEMAAAARKCDHRCPDCQERFNMGMELPFDCVECGPTAVGVGGARGGAKSHWMFSQICADDCQRFPGLKFLYLRKSVTAAREQIRGLLLTVCRHIPHNYREQAGTIEFPNGSYIVVKHFKDEKDIENFLGQEYDGIAIEELTTLTFDKWKNLMTCLRTSKIGWRPRFYGAWNWGGVGHFWVMKVFYTPWETAQERTTRYILALVSDNKYNNPEYINTLKSLTGWKYKSWYLGDPHFQSGQFFMHWTEDVHVYPNKYVHGFDPRSVSYFASFDHGLNHPCCFLLHAKDRSGVIFTLDEYHQNETVPSENADNILYLLKRNGLTVSDLDFCVAGRDCFSRNAEAKTIAGMYADFGIDFSPAETDRLNRWEIMANLLGDPEKGTVPKWFIHKNCKNLIAQIPMAQSHETRIGDIQKMNADRDTGEGGDDALEAASFALASEPSTAIRFATPIALGQPPQLICG